MKTIFEVLRSTEKLDKMVLELKAGEVLVTQRIGGIWRVVKLVPSRRKK